MLAGGIGRKTVGSIDVPEDADQGGTLIDQRDHRLRLDGAVLQRIDDRLLDFGWRPSLGADSPGIRNRNVASDIDVLVRQVDEVAGTHTGLDWNEQPTRRGLENRNAHRVADAELDLPRGPPIGKYIADPGRVICQDVDDLGGDANERVRETFRIRWVPAAVNFADLRPGGRHDGAAAADDGQHAQRHLAYETPQPTHDSHSVLRNVKNSNCGQTKLASRRVK